MIPVPTKLQSTWSGLGLCHEEYTSVGFVGEDVAFALVDIIMSIAIDMLQKGQRFLKKITLLQQIRSIQKH